MKKWTFLFLLFALSCSKPKQQAECVDLKEGIKGNDIARVSAYFADAIDGLPNKSHTMANLAILAQKISVNCSVTVEVVCYACIETLPEQSEIRITFSSSGSAITKLIDISQDSSMEMKFANMHD